MFRVVGTPAVEQFNLILVDLETPNGLFQVPIVNGWLEVQLAISRIPEQRERRSFFGALDVLCRALRTERNIGWYFLHKPPGLKLRFSIGAPDASLLGIVLSTVAQWDFPWVAGKALGSVFDQAELMPFAFRADAEWLLTEGADAYLEAAVEQKAGTEDQWVTVLIEVLRMLGLDEWQAYEAISRLVRLRSHDLFLAPTLDTDPVLDPSGLLSLPQHTQSAGFSESVCLLQTLNLLMNVWGLDAHRQVRILEAARARTRPMLLDQLDG